MFEKNRASNRTIRISFFVIMALCLTLVAASCGQPDPLFTKGAAADAPTGKIAYAANGDIYDWQNGSTHQITHDGDASSPSWSENGSQIVFVRTGDAYSDLWVANADGSNARKLTSDQPQGQIGTADYVCNAVWALDPTWSPVNDDIIFASDLGTSCPDIRPNYLWLMQGLGEIPHRIPASTTNGDDVEHPSYSPDGSKVVFDQRTTGASDLQRWTQLWTIDINSGVLKPLVTTKNATYDASWSPNGKWIAYIQRTGSSDDVWVIPADGGKAVQVTHLGNVNQTAWSPDSSKIAFFQVDGLGFKVRYVDFSVGANGAPTGGAVHDLFSADGIDTTSGLSWVK